MSAGAKYCPAGRWTAIYQGPSLGFLYVTNLMHERRRVNWRVYFSSPWFYTEGAMWLASGEQKAIPHGLPAAYSQFEVNPTEDTMLFSS